jgi:hypothetical protein
MVIIFDINGSSLPAVRNASHPAGKYQQSALNGYINVIPKESQ